MRRRATSHVSRRPASRVISSRYPVNASSAMAASHEAPSLSEHFPSLFTTELFIQLRDDFLRTHLTQHGKILVAHIIQQDAARELPTSV